MAINAPAQTSLPLHMESITIDQGLSQGYTSGITQDKKGFMWFTTGDGLNKYDGYTFTVYHHDSSDTTSLGSDDLTAVFEDSKGRLWIGTRNDGVDLLDRGTGVFTHIRHGGANSLWSDNILGVTEDKSGAIWVRTGQGIDRLQIIPPESPPESYNHYSYLGQTFVFTHIILDSAFESAKNKLGAADVFVDSRNRVLVTTNSKIWEVEFSGTLHSYRLVERYSFHANNYAYIAKVREDTVSRSLFLKTEEIVKFPQGDFDSAEKIYKGVSTLTPWTIDDKQRLWIPGNKNILWIRAQSGAIEIIPLEDSALVKAVNYSAVLYTDRSGVVWIGTGGYGILKYSSEKERFHHILPGHYFYQLLKSDNGSIITNTFYELSIKRNEPVSADQFEEAGALKKK